MPKPISLIVACAENRVIGRDGRLPWRIPEDTAHFHRLTAGQTVVLGRVCYETWPQVHADHRTPIVITRDQSIAQPTVRITNIPENTPAEPIVRNTNIPSGVRPEMSVRITNSVTAALALAQELPGAIMICGGQRIYEETLPLADRIYLTLVHAEVPGDTFFPEWRHLDWRETERRESADANYRYTFSTLERVW